MTTSAREWFYETFLDLGGELEDSLEEAVWSEDQVETVLSVLASFDSLNDLSSEMRVRINSTDLSESESAHISQQKVHLAAVAGRCRERLSRDHSGWVERIRPLRLDAKERLDEELRRLLISGV
ncbi:MAG: hypothetical protein WC538_00305 [Thermoanaerobaculia bacterium]|jgi:hypothetical protein